jgi:outer membrane autotransporter protein
MKLPFNKSLLNQSLMAVIVVSSGMGIANATPPTEVTLSSSENLTVYDGDTVSSTVTRTNEIWDERAIYVGTVVDAGYTGTISIEAGGSVTGAYATDGSGAESGVADIRTALIDVYGLAESGSISNAGAMTLTADAIAADSLSASSEMTGILINSNSGGIAAGSIFNTGLLTVDSTATSSGATAKATATGIEVNDYLTGSIENADSGSITVTATADGLNDSAKAIGIRVSALAHTIKNSGDITVISSATKATDGVPGSNAKGIYVENLYLGSTITNTGDITVDATTTNGDNFDSLSYGISVDNLYGDITNSGTIIATADTLEDATSIYAYGRNDGAASIITNTGLLSGNLYVDGNIDVVNEDKGTIKLAVAQTAVIGGNYTQGADATLEIGAYSADEYSDMQVGGTATFANGTTIKVDVPSLDDLVIDAVLEGVVTANAIVATSINVTDDSALFDFTADVYANRINLKVSSGTTASEIVGNGQSSGLAGLIDRSTQNSSRSAEMTERINRLAKLNNSELAKALAEMTPQDDYSAATYTMMANASRVIRTRQKARGASSGDEMFADRNVWVKPFGSVSEQDTVGGTNGYDADSAGIAMGVDGELASGNSIGVAVLYSNTNVDSKEVDQTAQIESAQVAIYGDMPVIDDQTTFGWQAGITQHKNTGNRAADTIESKFDSMSYFAKAELTRDYVMSDQFIVSPMVSANYQQIQADKYTETGGLDALSVEDTNASRLDLGLGVRGDYAIKDGLNIITDLGMTYDVLDEQNTMVSSFANSPDSSFTTASVGNDQFKAQAGVGLVIGTNSGMDLTIRYDLEADSDYMNHSGSAKLNWKF